jgi:hypothetical protein
LPLERKSQSQKFKTGEDKKIAEVCLYRYFHQLGKSRTFDWNSIPKDLSVAPSTANRWFRTWTESGDWLTFWDAVLVSRYGVSTVPKQLLNEMVHKRNAALDLSDRNRRTQYHTRPFRNVAALVGLDCHDRDPLRGYMRTKPNERARKGLR